MSEITDNRSMLIVGTGAMACLFSARLAAIGVKIIHLGTWQEGLAALQKNGVHLVDEDGQEWASPVEATADPSHCTGAKQALVLVKSWQTRRAARQLAECLHPGGIALTLQNGQGNYQALVDALSAGRAALGVTTVGATLLAPGRVRVGGNGNVILSAHPRGKKLADLLRTAGFSVEIVEDANALLWGKLVINAAINPLTALLRIPNGELLHRPAARSLMERAACEAAQVAAARGIRLPYPDPVRAVEDVARHTESNQSSMLRDVLRGSPTEIEAINGAIVRAGEQAGVLTPVNSLLWELVSALDGQADVRPAAEQTRAEPKSKPAGIDQRKPYPLPHLAARE
jgi:2-dehydropantoate 2-reductase